MASTLPVQALPLFLILLAASAPGAADFNISSLSGLLSPALTESLLVALPPCHLTGGNATLMVRRANDSKVVKSAFVVPPCRGRRELVSVVDSGAGYTVTRLSAYQVTNLTPGTKYYISYRVQKGMSTESSPETPMSTLPRKNMESIGLGMARTGGMVVITVLLSVAMFLLVVGLIIALALDKLARYRLRIVEPPTLPLEKIPNPDKDGPDFKPNLWMWVNPNIVYPPGKLVVERLRKENLVSSCHPALKEKAGCSKASRTQSWLPSSSQPSLPCKRRKKQKHTASSPSTREELTEEEAKDQDDSSSSRRRLPQAISPEGRLWSRPPLNYFHLIALALRNSPLCGLTVQQIYSFTREHFPFFRTAPEGWKNTVRHNLCFRDSFEKVPVSMQGEASTRQRSCLWRLTEEGHRRFAEEARTLASTRLESIRQCMSQPGVKPCQGWARGWGPKA
ncbi:forkhead box protein R1 [Sigmodon hispidus]